MRLRNGGLPEDWDWAQVTSIIFTGRSAPCGEGCSGTLMEADVRRKGLEQPITVWGCPECGRATQDPETNCGGQS